MTPEEMANATRLALVAKVYESQGVAPAHAEQLTTLTGPAFALDTGPAGFKLKMVDGSSPEQFAKDLLASPTYSIFAPRPATTPDGKPEPTAEQKQAQLVARARVAFGLPASSSAADLGYVPLGGRRS